MDRFGVFDAFPGLSQAVSELHAAAERLRQEGDERKATLFENFANRIGPAIVAAWEAAGREVYGEQGS